MRYTLRMLVDGHRTRDSTPWTGWTCLEQRPTVWMLVDGQRGGEDGVEREDGEEEHEDGVDGVDSVEREDSEDSEDSEERGNGVEHEDGEEREDSRVRGRCGRARER